MGRVPIAIPAIAPLESLMWPSDAGAPVAVWEELGLLVVVVEGRLVLDVGLVPGGIIGPSFMMACFCVWRDSEEFYVCS